MTFTEAAIEVLRREGKPLHFRKLTEIAIRESLLDHVGKIPEETMADQLAAHCRLPHEDRRVIPVQQGTFALTEWGLDEDPAGLEALVEPPPDGEPAYRGRERHPIPSRELARSTGRGEAGKPRRREEEERRGRRFPPPAEVAYEILAGAGRALSLADIAAQGAERLLMPDAFVRDGGSLRAALVEDNRRRESAGRKALFLVDGDSVTLVAQPEPGERVAAPAAARAAPVQTATELRRAALAGLRRRLRECDAATIEHVASRLLDKMGFRELKVAKRSREHVIYTARLKMGLGDLRHGIRIVRNGADASRRDVTELRRDLAHYGAQIGIVVSAGEVAREARAEATAAGQLPIVLLCGEALAEAFADAGLGTVPVVIPEVDDGFFRAAAEEAEKEEAARRARREERDRREGREPRERDRERDRDRDRDREPRGARREERTVSVEAVQAASEEPSGAPIAEPAAGEVIASAAAAAEAVAPSRPPQPVAPRGETSIEVPAELDDEGPEGEEDEDESEASAEGEPATASEASAGEAGAGADRRRRRRRRRRRGGRGRSREGAPQGQAAAGAEGAAGEAPAQGAREGVAAPEAPVAAPQSAPPPPAARQDDGDTGG
ncbi:MULTISPECIES: HTH domain-containing protein [Anaeromyxobacter]|uniref:HTH domain-containing protein n=1 Tax=Anaeromyxobacter TaxID=161492 RepID=UPI001F5AAD48|nr:MULTISPECIES: HTH domain-containing protein [unclassified Anaeromyxobacter]